MVSVWVYHLVLSFVKNKEDAEEVVQDTILSSLNGLEKFNRNSAVKTWVYKIAINKSKDRLKYNKRKKRKASIVSIYQNEGEDRQDIEPAQFVDPQLLIESKEKIDVIFSGINSLPMNQKEVLILTKLEHLTIQEVADTLDLSYKSIESLLARAKKNLKIYLEDQGIKLYQKKIK